MHVVRAEVSSPRPCGSIWPRGTVVTLHALVAAPVRVHSPGIGALVHVGLAGGGGKPVPARAGDSNPVREHVT